MKRARVFFLMLLPLFMAPAFAEVPQLNVKAVCEARAADAKKVQSPPDQSMTECVRDEEAAKRQLAALWPSTPASIRKLCESDGRALGMRSYLLTCIQIADDLKPQPKKEPKRGEGSAPKPPDRPHRYADFHSAAAAALAKLTPFASEPIAVRPTMIMATVPATAASARP